jgi:two-component system nitrogen regulation sensor histidine kinase GlnL
VPRDLTGVLEAVLAGVVVLDERGNVELLNSAACRILEMSAESTRGMAVERLLGPDHAAARLARRVLASGGSTAENACPVARRSHPDLSVDVAASPLFDPEGRVDGVALVLRDSTIQQTLQKMVAERESLTAFGQFAAGIAHEVKNPLGGIRGAAEILASRSSDAKTHEAAELIVREVDRIAALVDDLMVFARGDELRLAPTNLHRILDDVLDLLAVDPVGVGIDVERVFDPSIPETLLDADRLMQVFLNLARNALQAMDRKGTLSIATRFDLDHRLRDREGEQRPTVLVEIADTGPGMSPEVLEKLATPFFTTRPGGTGLGVAVARHWVSRHDGTLVVESAPGEGTRVRVALPLRVAS